MAPVVLEGSLPIRRVNSVLSMVRIWGTLTTLADSAAVEDIALDRDTRVTFRRGGTLGGAEFEPIDFPLMDFGHQRSLMVRRNLAFMFLVVGTSVGAG